MNPLALKIARATLNAEGWVPPTGFVSPHLVGPDGRSAPAFDVLSSQFRLAVFSPNGSGKTTLLRAFAHGAASRSIEGVAGARAPLLIRRMPIDTLLDLRSVLAELGVTATQDQLGELFHSGDLVLLIDGVDEMPDARLGAYHIANLLHRFPKLGAIVAARPGAFGAELSELNTYSLAPYSHDQVAALVRAMALGDDAATERFQRFLATADMTDLARTPLLVRMLFEASDGGTAPFISAADLFADFLDERIRVAVASSHGRVAGDQLIKIMGDLAVRLHVEGRLSPI